MLFVVRGYLGCCKQNVVAAGEAGKKQRVEEVLAKSNDWTCGARSAQRGINSKNRATIGCFDFLSAVASRLQSRAHYKNQQNRKHSLPCFPPPGPPRPRFHVQVVSPLDASNQFPIPHSSSCGLLGNGSSVAILKWAKSWASISISLSMAERELSSHLRLDGESERGFVE